MRCPFYTLAPDVPIHPALNNTSSYLQRMGGSPHAGVGLAQGGGGGGNPIAGKLLFRKATTVELLLESHDYL